MLIVYSVLDQGHQDGLQAETGVLVAETETGVLGVGTAGLHGDHRGETGLPRRTECPCLTPVNQH